MSFWETIEHIDGMPENLFGVVIGVVAGTSVLYFLVSDERPRIRTALALFVLAFAGTLAAAGIRYVGGSLTSISYVCLSRVSLFLAAVATINLIRIVIFPVALRRARLEPPPIAQDLLVGFAYVAIAILILSRSGIDIHGVIATSAVITAIIGFSLQDTLGNIMGGMALQMEHHIRVGDWIRIDDLEGKVKQIRWRQTSVETRNWDTMVIPNSALMKTKVTLLGRRAGSPRQRRQWVHFRVNLSHSPTKVIGVVEAAVQAEVSPCIAAEPKANCIVTDFNDGDAVYAVRYWLTDLSEADPTDSLIRRRIHAALRRANIPIASPMKSIRLTEENESTREREQNAEMQLRIDMLSKLDLLQPLTQAERRELASGLIKAPFVQGEAITRQGAQAHWLYIILDGEAEVEVSVEGQSNHVATLRGGEFFGEIGMMTGEPRRATVNARTDVTCYRLGKEGFEGILHRRPEIAEQISVILARRRVELDAVREQVSQEALRKQMSKVQGALFCRICEFFGINGHDGVRESRPNANGRRTSRSRLHR
jgi:small-conductance mechanosensitive channel/CRP-like cAMP-binding protein